MFRVVLDTNVFVSGLLFKEGTPSKILDNWRSGKYLLLTSPAIVSEVGRILQTLRGKKGYPIRKDEIDQLIGLLEKEAAVIPDLSGAKGIIPQDPEDEKFLACAANGGADFIVTGDHHLLALKDHKGIPIITARDFMDRLPESS